MKPHRFVTWNVSPAVASLGLPSLSCLQNFQTEAMARTKSSCFVKAQLEMAGVSALVSMKKMGTPWNTSKITNDLLVALARFHHVNLWRMILNTDPHSRSHKDDRLSDSESMCALKSSVQLKRKCASGWFNLG